MVACDVLGETPGWQELRGRFAGLLTQESVRGPIWQLTDIPEGARWRPRGTYRREWLEADLTAAGESVVPAASALLVLPEKPALAGFPPGCAQLTLHISFAPRRSGTGGPMSFPPSYWRARFAQALALPGELACWLSHQLGLATSSDPAAQAGIMMRSRQRLTELVDINGIRALPARACRSSSPAGLSPMQTARPLTTSPRRSCSICLSGSFTLMERPIKYPV